MHSRRMEYKSIEENIKKKFFNFLKWKKSQEIAKLLFIFSRMGSSLSLKLSRQQQLKKEKKKRFVNRTTKKHKIKKARP
jgi:hypothetical protein